MVAYLPKKPSEMRGKKVLLIDSHEGIQDSATRLLKRAGYEADAVSTGQEAKIKLENSLWDLVLIDLELPQMNGLELAHWIRQKKLELEIIIITGRPTFESMSEAMKLEVQGYLIKPWNKDLLLSTVKNALDKKHLKKKLQKTIAELKEKQESFSNIVEKMPDGIFVIRPEFQIEYVNRAGINILQHTSEKKIFKKLTSINFGKSSLEEVRLKTNKGTLLVLEIRSEPTQWRGNNAQLLIIRDITLRKRIEHALVKSEERYALIARSTNDGLWDWNLTTNKITYSPRWKKMIGYEEEELTQDPEEWLSRIHPEDRQRFQEILTKYKEGRGTFLQVEYRLKHKDGNYRWMLCRGLSARDKYGKVQRLVGSQIDLTQQKNAEKEVSIRKNFDELTHLGNRAWFINQLKQLIEHRTIAPTNLFALCYIDIDRFRMINDSLGHRIGDQLLANIALNISEILRPDDLIARLGGDEFGIIINNLRTEEDIHPVIERLQKEIEKQLIIENHELFITASIGITFNQQHYHEPNDVLRDAEIAMYQAKKSGRGQYEIFNQGMLKSSGINQNTVKELNLEHDLRYALEAQELELHYQPIVFLKNAKILGFEALIRWNHPKEGLISPAKFIPMAEDTGLIIPIGNWVLKEACHQLKQWQQFFHDECSLYISVNVSAKQFFHEQFVEIVQKTLNETQLDPHFLKLEITESILMSNPEYMRKILFQLKELGVSLSMDDFGTGYSSLSYLHKFPIDVLKVDRSFVSGMDEKDRREIVKTIVSLAINLDKDVIAEGVETPQHVEQLKSFGCIYGQGYLFSKPLPSEQAQDLLKQNRYQH